jgi:hypothetical protein
VSGAAKPIGVVIGAVGKLPYAGIGFYYLHHVTGLLKLGYDVYYVERQNRDFDSYDPVRDEMTSDPTYALGYLADVLPRFGIDADHYAFIDRSGACTGIGWSRLRRVLSDADFVLSAADPTWFDDLERCPRRVYVDGDPMFTQVAMATGIGPRAEAAKRYTSLFTYATRIGKADCTVPSAGRRWMAARPVVDTRYWTVTDGSASLPVTALMHWAAGKDVEVDGRTYGHKNREVEKLIDLPRRTTRPLRLAVGGAGVPKQRLAESGWPLVGALAETQTIDSYQHFISASSADLGIAKHAYVASRSGWFSDRSTCFLASGRPVLHQDTGCGEWLPVGEGVLLFSDMDSLIAALDSLAAHYAAHAHAARAMAEEHFEASTVLRKMLEAADLR